MAGMGRQFILFTIEIHLRAGDRFIRTAASQSDAIRRRNHWHPKKLPQLPKVMGFFLAHLSSRLIYARGFQMGSIYCNYCSNCSSLAMYQVNANKIPSRGWLRVYSLFRLLHPPPSVLSQLSFLNPKGREHSQETGMPFSLFHSSLMPWAFSQWLPIVPRLCLSVLTCLPTNATCFSPSHSHLRLLSMSFVALVSFDATLSLSGY